jgi:hypothetical protein
MKLETNTTINGTVVEYIGKIDELRVFHTELDSDIKLYFVNGADVVVGTIDIEAEMAQGVGYISELTFNKE